MFILCPLVRSWRESVSDHSQSGYVKLQPYIG